MFYILEILVLIIVIKVILKLTNGICKSNVCLVGKTALITGGSYGIGYQIALGLASRGCRVIIASRSCDEKVSKQITKHTNNPNVVSKHLDLSSLESVRELAKDITDTEDRLDILINNAGIGSGGTKMTSDGLHMLMQINYFGPFLLTHLLTDLLKKSAPSRIIFHSSILAYTHNLSNVDLLNNPFKGSKSIYAGEIRAYGNSKLCNIIAAQGFAKKLKAFNVTSNSVHPGVVFTTIFRTTFNRFMIQFWIDAICSCMGFIMKDLFEGAQTTIRLAVSNKLQKVTGKYFWDCVPFITPSAAKDEEFCKSIWKESERLVKLRPEEKL